jgi:hypothetical protein
MSEPPIAQLHAAIYDLFYETLSRYPPPHAPGAEPAGPPPHRLGDYLVYQGYLTPRELASALYDTQAEGEARPVPLGLALMRRYSVPAPVLVMTLLVQTLDRLEQAPSLPPRFLGELLLREAAITPEQLATVLEEQMLDYQQGNWHRLGDLITNHGWLDAESLGRALSELRA